MTHAASADEVRAFGRTVTDTLGFDVSEAKLAELEAILASRMEARRVSYAAYEAELRAQPQGDEVGVLASLLTVSETFFFRHEQQLSAGVDRLIAWARTEGSRTLRLSSFGCASGEEPYSLAMLLLERFPEGVDRFEITALDVNPIALERARRGEYGQWSLRATPSGTVDRWFERTGKTFRLVPSVRERVRFVQGNLAREDGVPAAGAQHAIFCRNVLMYFTAEQYGQAVARLASRLEQRGLLFLGHAETLRGLDTDFELISDGGAFYYRVGATCAERPDGKTNEPDRRPRAEPAKDTDAASTSWVQSIAQSAERVQALRVPDATAVRPAASASPLSLFREERFDQALEALRALPSTTTEEPEMMLLEAILLFHRGEWAAAETASRELLLHLPLAASAHYLLALCCEARNSTQAAMVHDQAAITSDPGFSLPRLHLGRMLRQLGDHERARDELVYARRLLEQEDAARLALFGAGLGRSSLLAFCDAELMQVKREVRP
jgi:chemotaxis protein methyltransferase CheR